MRLLWQLQRAGNSTLSMRERTQPLRRERHAHRWPSMVRGAMLARPTRRAWGYCDSSRERETQLSAWERTQPLRRERHAQRWPSTVRGAMLATTWNLSSPPVATILAGEHARQGLREMLLKTPERGAVPELVYRYPQIAMHLPQKAVSPFVQNDILKRPAGPGIAVLGTCWPRRLHRDLRLGHTIQGSHPNLDLVSTSEVITALSRNKNRQVSQKYCKEWLHNTSFSVELDRTHPSMVPVHEMVAGEFREGKMRADDSSPPPPPEGKE